MLLLRPSRSPWLWKWLSEEEGGRHWYSSTGLCVKVGICVLLTTRRHSSRENHQQSTTSLSWQARKRRGGGVTPSVHYTSLLGLQTVGPETKGPSSSSGVFLMLHWSQKIMCHHAVGLKYTYIKKQINSRILHTECITKRRVSGIVYARCFS